MRRRIFLLGGAALAAGGALATYSGFAHDIARAARNLEGRSSLVSSRFGAIEYGIVGDGPPVLMVHGTGGGFDQGLAAAPRLVSAGHRVIAPSRFGYLRSDIPADASSDAQADAFIDLLDALGVDRAPIIGVSAGALSALAFAIRHPARCSGVVAAVPATYVPGRTPQPPSPLASAIYAYALKSDFLFWLTLKTAEPAMVASILATDIDVFRTAAPPEQQRARQLLWDILPVSRRARGLRNDALLAGDPAPMPMERITAPTLAIALEDDRYGTYAANAPDRKSASELRDPRSETLC
ncbi:MAG: alpha/beta fold hydrolase [Hyphomonadaceae bacterium]